MNMEPIQELASCFIPSPFIKQLPHLFSKKTRLWYQFHFMRRCFQYKEILGDPLFNLLLSSFLNSYKIYLNKFTKFSNLLK